MEYNYRHVIFATALLSMLFATSGAVSVSFPLHSALPFSQSSFMLQSSNIFQSIVNFFSSLFGAHTITIPTTVLPATTFTTTTVAPTTPYMSQSQAASLIGSGGVYSVSIQNVSQYTGDLKGNVSAGYIMTYRTTKGQIIDMVYQSSKAQFLYKAALATEINGNKPGTFNTINATLNGLEYSYAYVTNITPANESAIVSWKGNYTIQAAVLYGAQIPATQLAAILAEDASSGATTTTVTTTTVPATTVYTTTTPPSNSCVAALGYVCENTALASNGDLSLTFGQDLGFSMLNPQVACSLSTQLPSTFYSINSGNPLASGATVQISGVPCGNVNGPTSAFLWLSYKTSTSAPTTYALVATLSLSTTSTGSPNPYNYTYTGSYNGSTVTLSWVPNHSTENDSGSRIVGVLSNFQTKNPYYSCLNGQALNVWSDPNYSNVLVVHNGDQGSQCTYITETLTSPTSNSTSPNPYNYTYTGTYNGSLKTLSWVPNHSTEDDSGSHIVGYITNFQTRNPHYSCLNGESIYVWSDPSYPNELVVHNGDQGSQCTYITAILQPSNVSTFSGLCKGLSVSTHSAYANVTQDCSWTGGNAWLTVGAGWKTQMTYVLKGLSNGQVYINGAWTTQEALQSCPSSNPNCFGAGCLYNTSIVNLPAQNYSLTITTTANNTALDGKCGPNTFATFATGILPNQTGGTPSPNPYNYTYTGSYNGSTVTLSWVPNHSTENDSGSRIVGVLSNFQTKNPYYSCLNSQSIYVWSDPSYPNELVVHNGDQGSQCTYITETFTPPSTTPPPSVCNTFTIVYEGKNITCGNFKVVLVDVGQPNNTGSAPAVINVYNNNVLTNITQIAPQSEGYFSVNGNKLGVNVSQTFLGLYAYQKWADMELVPGAVPPSNFVSYNYSGQFVATQPKLTLVTDQAIENLSDAQLVGKMYFYNTNNTYYSCLDGSYLNVWTAPEQYPGQLIVHNGDQGTQCTYITLTFPGSVYCQTPATTLTAGQSMQCGIYSLTFTGQIDYPSGTSLAYANMTFSKNGVFFGSNNAAEASYFYDYGSGQCQQTSPNNWACLRYVLNTITPGSDGTQSSINVGLQVFNVTV